MTMYNHRVPSTAATANPSLSLCRYRARKQQLHASMLDYTTRFQSMQLLRNRTPPPKGTGSTLEIRARRKVIARHSDPELSLRGLNHSHPPLPRRPFSFDDKLLLQGKGSHRDLAPIGSRDTKSEYHRSLSRTSNAPSISVPGPPNSPSCDRSDSVRVSFVSASDLYDLVEFVPKSKSPRNPFQSRVADGVKLNDHFISSGGLDTDTRKDKGSNLPLHKTDSDNGVIYSKGATQSTKGSSNDGALDGFVMGKAISHHPKPDKKKDPKSLGLNLHSPRQSAGLKDALPVIQSADRDEIYPLNVFLETTMLSHLESRTKNNKLHQQQRPKRAKRMQLHKSDLVSIPENGHCQSSLRTSGESTMAGCSTQEERIRRNGQNGGKTDEYSEDKLDKRSSGQSNDDFVSESRGGSLKTGDSLSVEKVKSSTSGRKQSKQRQAQRRERACKVLDSIIIKNNIYPSLPWETQDANDCLETSATTTALTFDPSGSATKMNRHGKVKKLVFLRDQSHTSYYRR